MSSAHSQKSWLIQLGNLQQSQHCLEGCLVICSMNVTWGYISKGWSATILLEVHEWLSENKCKLTCYGILTYLFMVFIESIQNSSKTRRCQQQDELWGWYNPPPVRSDTQGHDSEYEAGILRTVSCRWRIIHCPTLRYWDAGSVTRHSRLRWEMPQYQRQIIKTINSNVRALLVSCTKCVGGLQTVNEKCTTHFKQHCSEIIKAEIWGNWD